MIIFIFILLFFIALLLYKVIKGPTIWDRILTFNLLSVMVILLIVFYANDTEYSYLIDIAIVYALLGFIGIVFISRFVQGKGRI